MKTATPTADILAGIDFADATSLSAGITALAAELGKASATATEAKLAATTLVPIAAPAAAGTMTTTTSTSKDADTIKLKALPDHNDYDTWRMKAIADIAAASGQPAQVLGFLDEIKDGTVTDAELLTTRDAKMASLDIYEAMQCDLESSYRELRRPETSMVETKI